MEALDVKVLIICEIWLPAASDYMAIEGYRRRVSAHVRRGGGIGIWVRDDWGSELRKQLDIDHCLMITVAARGRKVLIIGGHMPQRNQAALMYKVLEQVKQCMEKVNVGFIIFMADWNRHLLQDAKLSKWLQDHHLHVVAQGEEPRLHKDWCVVHRSMAASEVAYLPELVDHPIVVAKCMQHMRSSGTGEETEGHPVSVKGWGEQDKRTYGDALEMLTSPAMTVEQWLQMNREVLAMTDAQRQCNRKGINVTDRLLFDMQSQGLAADRQQDMISEMVAEQRWAQRISDSQLLRTASYTRQLSQKLCVKAAKPFVALEKVWDPDTQRIVQGEMMKSVVAREAGRKNVHINGGRWPAWMGQEQQEVDDSVSKVMQASRQKEGQVTGKQSAKDVSYAFALGEVIDVLHTQANSTMTVDGLATALLKYAGVNVLAVMAQLLASDMRSLPAVMFIALHLPLRKKPGLEFNACLSQIVVTSAGLRVSQKATLMRLQRIVSPENLGNFQHAALPGLACTQLRRYMYTAMMIRLRQGHDIAVLFLDLSNGYGQTDRGLLKEQVQWTPELHRPLEQQMQQYQRLKVHVQTAAGRSAAYPVTSGVIQGGGMDPYFYVWNSKILKAGIDRSSAGKQLRLPDGRQICIRAGVVVLGILCNVLRKALNLPRRTPKLFFIADKGMGLSDPYAKLWENGFVELMRAANSRHEQVRVTTQQVLQDVWRQTPPATAIVTDYHHVCAWARSRSWVPELLENGVCGDEWTSRLTADDLVGIDTLLIVADTSGAEDRQRWGLACVVANVQGLVYEVFSAWIECKFTNSMLLEATALTEGINAMRRRLSSLGIKAMLLVVGADNKQAIERLSARTLTYRGGDIMDRLVADNVRAAQLFQVMYTWIPAQHDTGHRDRLSTLNKLVDKKSRTSQEKAEGDQWSWPNAWHDGETLGWKKDGILIVNVQLAVQAELKAWQPTVSESSTGIQPNAHVHYVHERAGLRRWWQASRLYHPRDMAAALLLSFYPSLRDLYSEDQDQQECPGCGEAADCAVQHRLQDCVFLRLNLETLMGRIHEVLWYKVWQGWLLEYPERRCSVVLQWCLPRDATRVMDAWKQRNVQAWPLYHASFPAEQCYQAMAALMQRGAGRMPAVVLHAIAEYARPVHQPHDDSIQAYRRKWLSSHPLVGAVEVKQDADAPECGVWVPVELLQALTAICPGLRAAAHPRANKQAVFLAEKPYREAYDRHISAQPRSRWQPRGNSSVSPRLRIHVARRPLTAAQQQSAGGSQVVEQRMVIGEFVVSLIARGAISLEILHRWDAVRRYLTDGPGSLVSCR